MLKKHIKIILEGRLIKESDHMFDNVITVGDDFLLETDIETINCIVEDKIIECINKDNDKILEITYILKKKKSFVNNRALQ